MVPGHNRTWANYTECLKFLTNETRERVRALPTLPQEKGPSPSLLQWPEPGLTQDPSSLRESQQSDLTVTPLPHRRCLTA